MFGSRRVKHKAPVHAAGGKRKSKRSKKSKKSKKGSRRHRRR